ncbi:MAG: diaminopimelate decarboxylase [Hyphomicrobiales bacterium]
MFTKQNNNVLVENINILELVKKIETPAYIYSKRKIIENVNTLKSGLKKVDGLICFSVKANSNLNLLKILVNEGLGMDIVSGGELRKALLAGCNSKKIVFSGVGKSPIDIEYAIREDILLFNVESESELFVINEISKKLGKITSIAVRVNPDVSPNTHPYISTGLKENKFGISINDSLNLHKKIKNFKNIRVIGVDFHIGSQITEVKPYIDSLIKIENYIEELRNYDIQLEFLDIGGGFGLIDNSDSFNLGLMLNEIANKLKSFNLKIIVEPGRSIIGNTSFLISKVLYIKKNESKNFAICDAGMNDLLRPALYKSYHEIVNLSNFPSSDKNLNVFDIVGPVCESSDCFFPKKSIDLSENDYIAIMNTGAYGYSMASNYNSRPKPVEILVDDNKCIVIRKKESIDDLMKNEITQELL